MLWICYLVVNKFVLHFNSNLFYFVNPGVLLTKEKKSCHAINNACHNGIFRHMTSRGAFGKKIKNIKIFRFAKQLKVLPSDRD